MLVVDNSSIRRALAQSRGLSDEEADFYAAGGDAPLPPTPKSVDLKDTYNPLPDHITKTVADTVEAMSFHAGDNPAIRNLVNAIRTPMGKALTAAVGMQSPAAIAEGAVAASDASNAAAASLTAHGQNPDPNVTIDLRGVAKMSPLAHALGAVNPALGPDKAIFQPKRSELTEAVGGFVRDSVVLGGAIKTAAAVLPQAITAARMGVDPNAANMVGQVAKFLKAQNAMKINTGRIMTESIAALGAGGATSIIDDLVQSDGTFNPGQSFKKAALTSILWAGPAGVMSGISEGAQVMERELVKRALNNPEARAALKPTAALRYELRKAGVPKDQATDIAKKFLENPVDSAKQFSPPAAISIEAAQAEGLVESGTPFVIENLDPAVESALSEYRIAAKSWRRAMRQGPEEVDAAVLRKEEAEVNLRAALEQSKTTTPQQYAAVWENRNLTQTETGAPIPGQGRVDASGKIAPAKTGVTLGTGLGGVNEEAKRVYANIKKLLARDEKTGINFSLSKLPDETAQGVRQLLSQLPAKTLGRLQLDEASMRAMGNVADVASQPKPLLQPAEREALIKTLGGPERRSRFQHLNPDPELEAPGPKAPPTERTATGQLVNKPKTLAELSDAELIQLGREHRSIEMQKKVTADTVAPETVVRPTADKAYDAAKRNLASIRNVDKKTGGHLTFEDLAKVSGVPKEKLSKMSNSGVRALVQKHGAELKGMAAQKADAVALDRAFKGRGITTPENKAAVAQVLQQHGVTPGEVQALINAEFGVSVEGPQKIYGNAIYPTDISTFKADKLDKFLAASRPELERFRSLKAEFLRQNPGIAAGEDIDQLVVDNLNSLKPQRTETGTSLSYAENSVLRGATGRKNPLRPDDEEYLKGVVAEADEAGVAGYPSDVIKVEPKSIHPVKTKDGAEVPVNADEDYSVLYTSAEGKQHMAVLRGKQIIESNLSGIMTEIKAVKKLRAEDTFDSDVSSVILGSGLGGLQKEWDRLVTRFEKAGADHETLKALKDPARRKQMLFTLTLPTHMLHREPAFRIPFDAVLNREDSRQAIMGELHETMKGKTALVMLKQAYPQAYQALNVAVREMDKALPLKGKMLTDAERAVYLTEAMGHAGGPEGAALVQKGYDAIRAYRELGGKHMRSLLAEKMRIAGMPEPQQKIVNDIIERLMGNPDYAPLAGRNGRFHVSTKDGGRMIRREAFASESEALQAVKDAQAKGYNVTLEDFEQRLRKNYGGGKVRSTSTIKIGEEKMDLPLDDLMVAADESSVSAMSEDINKIIQLQAEGQIRATDPRLQRRDYTPGFKDDLIEDVIPAWEKMITNVADRLPAEKLANLKDSLMKQFEDAMITQHGATRAALVKHASDYMDLFINTNDHNRPMFNAARSLAAHWLLGLSGLQTLQNFLQPAMMTMPEAVYEAGGIRGMAHFINGYRISTAAFALKGGEAERAVDVIAHLKLPQAYKEVLGKLHGAGRLTDLTVRSLFSDAEKVAIQEAPTMTHRASRMLMALNRLGERTNRFHDAITFTGIGIDKGLAGDDLYNFVRRKITRTQLDYTETTSPSALTTLNVTAKSAAKTMTLFTKFATEAYNRQMEYIDNMFRPRKGTSRLAAPVSAGMLALLGGSYGINYANWIAGGALGPFGAATPGKAWITSEAMKAFARIPDLPVYGAKFNRVSPVDIPLGMTFEGSLKSIADHLAEGSDDPESTRNTILHGIMPNIAGISLANNLAPRVPGVMDIVGNNFAVSNLIRTMQGQYAKATHGNIATASNAMPTIVGNLWDAKEIIRTGKVEYSVGKDREALQRNATWKDVVRAGLGLTSHEVINERMDARHLSKIMGRRNAIEKYIKDNVKNSIYNHRGEVNFQYYKELAEIWNASMATQTPPPPNTFLISTSDLAEYRMKVLEEAQLNRFKKVQSFDEKKRAALAAEDANHKPKKIPDEIVSRDYIRSKSNRLGFYNLDIEERTSRKRQAIFEE